MAAKLEPSWWLDSVKQDREAGSGLEITHLKATLGLLDCLFGVTDMPPLTTHTVRQQGQWRSCFGESMTHVVPTIWNCDKRIVPCERPSTTCGPSQGGRLRRCSVPVVLARKKWRSQRQTAYVRDVRATWGEGSKEQWSRKYCSILPMSREYEGAWLVARAFTDSD